MKQPGSLHCFVCGVANPFGLHLDFYETAPGEVTASFTAPTEYQSYPGIVHGGIVAAMLDEVSGRALMGVDSPRFMFTARLDIRYRKNVPIGVPLRLVGHAGKSKGKAAVATGEIYGPDGTLLAQAEALLVDVPDDIVQTTNLDDLGWKVYPDDVSGAAR
jgi:acyl-coenzyme A thioesterase PaaI-like protein